MERSPIPPELQSSRLPEFGGLEVGWAMCRNRMCRNFGYLYGSDPGAGGTDLRYDVLYKHGKISAITCRYCMAEIQLHSANAIRPLARHFLSESLPFIDCPLPDCESHGRNVFENFGLKRGKVRGALPYHLNNGSLRCYGRRKSGKRCKKSITPGTALSRTDTPEERCRVFLRLLLIRLGVSVTVANGFDIDASSFYDAINKFGSIFRDYHAYRNSFFLKPGHFKQEDNTAVVHTDVLQVSLKRLGKGPARNQRLDVIVSVLRLEKSWFILAAHPFYLPKGKCPSLLKLEADVEGKVPLVREFAGLHTIVDDGPLVGVKRKHKSKAKDADSEDAGDADSKPEPGRREISPRVADGGHFGYMMHSPYAPAAHFLVVNRMLRRFKRVAFYMDAAQDLSSAAMVTMRKDIASNRVQIALMMHAKRSTKKGGVPKRGIGMDRENLLPLAYADMEKRARELLESPPKNEDGENDAKKRRKPPTPQEKLAAMPRGDLSDDRARAILWSRTHVGAGSKDGGFAWLAFPGDGEQYKNCRTLWLTQGPGQTLKDGTDLLVPVTLQSVDSACQTLRRRINTFKRPVKAAVGVSYTDSPFRVEAALGELRTHLLQRNYSRRAGKRWSETSIPAERLVGIEGKDGTAVDMEAVLWEFSLNLDRAGEISEWMAT